MLEYFISTHGARKGLADTALRTADSGYLTRRLIDVAQDVIVLRGGLRHRPSGVWLSRSIDSKAVLEPSANRIIGRFAAARRGQPETGEVIVDAQRGDRRARSPTPIDRRRHHAGPRRSRADLCGARTASAPSATAATWRAASWSTCGEAVGIIAAQSIGEPGTQLTMRTFHTGGVAGEPTSRGSAARRGALRGARAEGQGHHLRDRRRGRDHAARTTARARSRVVSSELYQRRATTLPRRLRARWSTTATRSRPRPGARRVGRDGEGRARRRRVATVAARPGRGTVDSRQAPVLDPLRGERGARVHWSRPTARIRVEDGEHVTPASSSPKAR